MKKFLIIELFDVEVVSFLVKLQYLLNNGDLRMLPHITLRGPYNTKIRSKILTSSRDTIKSPIVINGVECFYNPNELVVYFKAIINGVEKTWWKPSYPQKKYGLNPHITIYKGKNKALAQELIVFLNRINLEFKLYNFEINIYNSGDRQLKFFLDKKKTINYYLKQNDNDFYSQILSKIEDIIKKNS